MDSQRLHANTGGADILRGVAILIVFAYHSFGSVYGWYTPWSGWHRDFSSMSASFVPCYYVMTQGWAGVPLFFVISGFCIHYSYLRSSKFAAGKFFWRRFWRIYPAYVVALLVFTVVTSVDIRTGQGAFQFLSHSLFAHNVKLESFYGINPSFWSIAIEVQLYLLYPLLLFLRSRIGLPKSMAVLLAIGCVWRVGSLWLLPLPDIHVTPAWSCPLVSWFDWSLGALIAERFATNQRTFERPLAWLAALVPLFFGSTLIKPLTILSFSLAALVSAVLLDVALHVSWRKGLTFRFLAFVGGVSYSMYLWHQPLLAPLRAGAAWLTGSTVVAWLALLPMVLVISWLSFVLLENPGINVGRSLWGLLTGRATPQPAAVDKPRTQSDRAAPARKTTAA
jgi:peptidoglycan/LPS O-acetylase OafA/YrhL